MNLHLPQSVEASTELRMIAAVPLQIVSPRESTPIVSVVQDTLVGANRFTRPDVLFTKKEALNLLVHAKRWDGRLPAPVTTTPQPMWSGAQLMSLLLPPISLKMKNSSDQEVVIYNGELQTGTLDKAVFSKQLLHIIYNDYGPEITVDFLDALQAMIATFLMNSGFSVGISDLIADRATNEEIGAALSNITKTIEDQILQLHTGLFENSSGRSNQEEFESKIMGILNKAVNEAGKIGLKSLAPTNRMTNMVKSGSKGSDVNVSQMVATLGQTAIEGRRVPNGFQHRTLPHFKRFDDSAQARGFIPSSFIKGLQPDEFFFHAMSGREGLIDTAVKTADTGYMQRKIRVALEDLVTQHDGSVRDAGGNIVQIAYGEDGANATKLEGQPLPIADLSDDKLAQEYAADGATDPTAYINAAKGDRALLVEQVYLGKPQKMVRYPVHLERLLYSLRDSFGLRGGEGTVTAQEALDAQATILNRTHAHNRLWAALVRWHLRPTNLKKIGYTKVALDAAVQQIILKHWKSWVEPGQPVGVIAAQSIGEPATQLTLNSVDYDTEIIIARDGVIMIPKIGEFIDEAIKNCEKHKITTYANGQVYAPLDDGHDWKAMSCDEHGKVVWTRLEAVTRHPVVNEDGSNTILEVETASGRMVKATNGHSFLTYRDGKIVELKGSDLKIGDELPILNSLNISALPTMDALELCPFHLDEAFGALVGSYLVDGSSNSGKIIINSPNTSHLIQKYLDTLEISYNILPDTLVINSENLTEQFSELFGTQEKKLPAAFLAAPDAFICGIIKAMFHSSGTVSGSQMFVYRVSNMLARYGIFGTFSSRKISPWVPATYTFTIATNYVKKLATLILSTGETDVITEQFNDVVLDRVKSIRAVAPLNDVVYDLTIEGTKNFTVGNLLGVRDTFHLSGVAAKSNMTRGVPRLNELLKATKKPKATEVTIPLRRDLRDKKEEARRVAQELEFTLLQDIVTTARIYFDPRDSATLIAEDADWLAYMAAFELARSPAGAAVQAADPLAGGGVAETKDDADAPAPQQSGGNWVLRMELDRERMFAKDITMDDIAFVLKSSQPDITTLYTDYNATRLVMRIRGTDLNNLKTLQNKILTATAVRGIPGLRSVSYSKTSDTVEFVDGAYRKVDQYTLVSDGTNFIDVITHPDVDASRVVSSDIHDMFNNLGIEACRATLYKEINAIFSESGENVNYRHIGLLLDKMCHKGRVMSVDRYGINKNDIGPLAKMSFEQTEDIALRSAIFADRDPVLGISANVMLGAPIRAGTAFSQILYDEVAAVKLAESTPAQRVAPPAGPVRYSDDQLDAALYDAEDEDDACAPSELRLHVPMPAAPLAAVTEEMDEDVDITIVG
jgi:DNA-directed RNA polymerase beta' subunit